MSADPAQNGGLGCGGVLIILLVLGVLMGLAGMGSDEDSWCPPDHWACQEEEIPRGGEVIDGTLYCPESQEANKAMDGCVDIKAALKAEQADA